MAKEGSRASLIAGLWVDFRRSGPQFFSLNIRNRRILRNTQIVFYQAQHIFAGDLVNFQGKQAALRGAKSVGLQERCLCQSMGKQNVSKLRPQTISRSGVCW